ncbi:MAG: hypothetical protein RIF46_12270, partial [Cyclobacteriaceae bacterium]
LRHLDKTRSQRQMGAGRMLGYTDSFFCSKSKLGSVVLGAQVWLHDIAGQWVADFYGLVDDFRKGFLNVGRMLKSILFPFYEKKLYSLKFQPMKISVFLMFLIFLATGCVENDSEITRDISIEEVKNHFQNKIRNPNVRSNATEEIEILWELA